LQASDLAALEALAGPNPERARTLGNAWLQHMRAGDFEAAWKVSDEVLRLRNRCSHLPRHLQWVWNGEPLAGKRVLIRCYHGLGDTVQFIRYAPLVRQLAAHVTVWAQPELLSLLRTMRGSFDELLPLHDASPDCEFDIDVELMELPHVFRTTAATTPSDVPYLHVPRTCLGGSGNFNVGLVWAAGDWDERRSIPFNLVRKFASAPGVTWHILQRGAALHEWNGAFGINSGHDDVLEAARVIAALDLLISVDTLPAHLAGALGTPTWTLLHADADWRWMARRNDSPWYPTMRLLRQRNAGDWQSVIDVVLEELKTITTESPCSAQPALPAPRA
jgi:Glycosyltransferase family 9 (heptosyltransferase)